SFEFHFANAQPSGWDQYKLVADIEIMYRLDVLKTVEIEKDHIVRIDISLLRDEKVDWKEYLPDERCLEIVTDLNTYCFINRDLERLLSDIRMVNYENNHKLGSIANSVISITKHFKSGKHFIDTNFSS